MNVLERWAEEELTRVPSGPPAAELRHRVRVRRARRVGSVAAVAIVLAILGIAATLQSPASQRVQVTEPVPTEPTTAPSTTALLPGSHLPLATTAEFPPLARIIRSVTAGVKSNLDPKAVVTNPSSAEIVATTDARAYPIWGGHPDDKPIYVVQVVGKFMCESCSGPVRSQAPRGDALQFFFDSSGNGFGFGLSPQPKHIDQLGAVYRLPMP
ncbi:MAG: hypothetical protein QOG50_524 [Actinomycetota bacterium]|nr:hypothetical protein [Actinomycetota bacterium]